MKAPKVKHRKERGTYRLVWYDAADKEHYETYKTKTAADEARKAKVKEQKLSSSKAAQYEDISDSEKRYLFDLYKHSENQGCELWDAVRHYERFLATSSIDRIKI